MIMKPSRTECLAAVLTAGILQSVHAAPPAISGPFRFSPIAQSVEPGSIADLNSPWLLPAGFEQAILSDETDLNIYDGITYQPDSVDWNDMNVLNETGRHAGRYLYRTHEVRHVDPEDGSGGSVSVVDTWTGAAKVLALRYDWEALDGIEWTSWGTLLFAEEAGEQGRPDPDFPSAERGLLYEVAFDPLDPSTAASITARPALGAFAHEGIVVDAGGNVYVIDEFALGAICKFVPDNAGDLSSGQLYALKVTDPSRTGAAEWVALDRDAVQIDARTEALGKGATTWGRPEDLDLIRNVLYAAITSEAKVIAIDLKTPQPFVSNFVEAGVNVPVEGSTRWGVHTGFRSPDNVAVDRAGNLWIVEDNVPSDIWVATPDRNRDGRADNVHLFASLSDRTAEGTGIYFGKDSHVLFVNVQHSVSGNDKTMILYKSGTKNVLPIQE
jgi:hypothetical protein